MIDERILCMHGGLSPELKNLTKINEMQRPVEVADSGLFCDLLWSDPDKKNGWHDNEERGAGQTFGKDIVSQFCEEHDLDMICRAH